MTTGPTAESLLRPLAQHVPRREGDALVFTTPDREVRVEGDPRLASEILARCDGLSTAEEIANGFGEEEAEDVLELIDLLAESEVVVDCTQAYRLFHRQSGIRSGFFRELGDAELDDLMGQSFAPGGLAERREPLRPEPVPVLDLTRRRSSAWPGEAHAVSYPELSTVLSAMYRLGSDERPVPSAGGLYPLVLHAVIREPLPPLELGLWWYDPWAQDLRLVREGRIDLESLLTPHPTTDRLIAAGRPVVTISADLERAAHKYSNRGYRYALMEAGAAMQNAYLAAAELDLPVRAVGGFDDEGLQELLALPDRVTPQLAVLLGR
jgi:SagB-type dehydrogenase family enzyme